MKKIIIALMLCGSLGAVAQNRATVGYETDFEGNNEGISCFDYIDPAYVTFPWIMESGNTCSSTISEWYIDPNKGKNLRIWSNYSMGTSNVVEQSLSAAALKASFNAGEHVVLSFDYKEFLDCDVYDVYSPPFDKIRSTAQDGVYLSVDDGVTYKRIMNFDFIPNETDWKSAELKLKLFGLTLNNQVRIKFQCYSAYGKHDILGKVQKYLLIDNLKLKNAGAAEETPYRVSFAYDDVGNRTDKFIVLEFNATPSSAQLKSFEANEPIVSEEMMGELQIGIAPNPTSGLLKMLFTNGNDEMHVHYTLHNLSGKLLQQGTTPAVGEKALSLMEYPNGIYLLRVKKEKETLTYKIIKK